MKQFILSIVIIGQLNVAAFAGENEGAKLYQDFESMRPDVPLFIPTMVEVQKLNYKSERWDEFFAYAVYYRAKFLRTPVEQEAHFDNRMFSLESTALIKHCLYPEAKAVAEFGLSIAQRLGPKGTQ